MKVLTSRYVERIVKEALKGLFRLGVSKKIEPAIAALHSGKYLRLNFRHFHEKLVEDGGRHVLQGDIPNPRLRGDILAENGKLLCESPLFQQEPAIADIDLEKLEAERLKTTSFGNAAFPDYRYVPFLMTLKKPEQILRHYSRNPFIPEQKEVDLERVKAIMTMQAMGLVKRLQTVHQQKVIVGESGLAPMQRT